ncbi:MAG: hypothetical protein MH132_12450 [Hydrotalea sp.]|nr:hypothetical protein [Hydrotalea sp.]
MKKTKNFIYSGLLLFITIISMQSFSSPAKDNFLRGGCKYTGDITDYCRSGNFKVLNCVNNTETDDCNWDDPIGL